MTDPGAATTAAPSADDDAASGDARGRAAGRPWPQLVTAVVAVVAAVIVAVALLRPDPLGAADEVRDAAAAIAELATTDPASLDERGTTAFARQAGDGRIDLTALDAVAGYRPETPVVLDRREDEARVLVVLRDEDRRRLELILLRDDAWQLDRFELY